VTSSDGDSAITGGRRSGGPLDLRAPTPVPSLGTMAAKTSRKPKTSVPTPAYTVPGMTTEQGGRVAAALQQRLNALNDLSLTLKHIHWNVVGPHFIAVHQMLDPQVDVVRGFADEVAERIATLGASPVGTPGGLVAQRTWDDYAVGRAGAIEHLGALDVVYQGVIEEHRQVAAEVEEADPVTNDLLITQLGQLELFHWFVRAHLENSGGELVTQGARSETAAVSRVSRSRRRSA
jgi:starvation-inducible DNA-binding protein